MNGLAAPRNVGAARRSLLALYNAVGVQINGSVGRYLPVEEVQKVALDVLAILDGDSRIDTELTQVVNGCIAELQRSLSHLTERSLEDAPEKSDGTV